ncbi:MAG: ATP synthase subunit C [Gemmiger sp.]|nr:ATP synthase subunit C [Gemmiger sp.]
MNTALLILAAVAPMALVAVTIFAAIRGGKNRKHALRVNIAAFAMVLAVSCFGAFGAFAEDTTAPADSTTTSTTQAAAQAEDSNANNPHNQSMGLGLLAAALVTGLAGIGGGIAVAAGAPAAIAANSENPKTFGKSLIFVALGESIALYGLVISIMILNKLV